MNKNNINEYNKFKGLYKGLKRKNKYKLKNRESLDVIRDIEILKIKLIDIENYLDGKDIYTIIGYLNMIDYNSDLNNLIIEKPDRENFWLTIWKYQIHSTEDEIVIKIGYKRYTSTYNAITNYTDNFDAYSSCIYTEINLLISYFIDYLFPLLISKEKNYIDPLRFIE